MTSTRPPGRYAARDRPTRSRRRNTVIVLVVAIIVGLVIATVAYRNFNSAPIAGKQNGFSLNSDGTVTVQFSVTRDDPSRAGVCIVRGLSYDGSETGRREVYIPPTSNGTSSFKSTVHTSHPPVLGDIFGCSYSVPSYLGPR